MNVSIRLDHTNATIATVKSNLDGILLVKLAHRRPVERDFLNRFEVEGMEKNVDH